MQLNTAVRSAIKGRWTRVVAGAFTLLAITAVPALGLTRLGSDLASFWQSSNTDAALAEGPVTFDAPTSILLSIKAHEKEANLAVAEQGASSQKKEVTVLDDWA